MKRIISIAIALIVMLSCLSVSAEGPEMDFDIMSQSALLVNLDMNRVIFSKNADKKLPTTAFNKIMTAIVALENTEDIGQSMVTVSKNAVSSPALGGYGSGIKSGESISMRDMIAMILVGSANDCCIAIAEAVAGSEQQFVAMMNQTAKGLGCKDTLFTDVHGMDDEGQYTTCEDMRKIIDYGRGLPNFFEYCLMSQYTAEQTNKNDSREISTTNLMMKKGSGFYYSPIRGIKYGFTSGSGRNFASTATKNGYNYMLITMNGPIRNEKGDKLEENSAYQDAKNIYSWAFSNFRIKEIVGESIPVADVPVKFSHDSNSVQAVPEGAITAIIPKGTKTNELSENGDLEYVLDLPEFLTAPVNKGQVLGTLTVKLDGEALGEVSLLAGQSLNKSEYVYILEQLRTFVGQAWVKVVIIALAVIIVAYLTIMIISNYKRMAKRKLLREQRELDRNKNGGQDRRQDK